MLVNEAFPRRRGRGASLSLSEIAQHLAGDAVALCQYLLPNGRREGAEWRCGSINGGRLHRSRAQPTPVPLTGGSVQMSRRDPGLHPIGSILDTVVIDLARRTGRLPRYRQLLNSSNCHSGNRAITRDSTA